MANVKTTSVFSDQSKSHSPFRDWVKENYTLLNTPLSNEKSNDHQNHKPTKVCISLDNVGDKAEYLPKTGFDERYWPNNHTLEDEYLYNRRRPSRAYPERRTVEEKVSKRYDKYDLRVEIKEYLRH